MNGFLDKMVSIFIGLGSVFTGFLLASWIYHYLLEFVTDEVFGWNRQTQEPFFLKDLLIVLIQIMLMAVVFGFLVVAISYGVFQLVNGFFNAYLSELFR